MKRIDVYPFGFVLALMCFSSVIIAQSKVTVRERLSFNDNWLFQKGDPKGAEGKLAYDKIKVWIRASGNELIADPDSVKGIRPDGNVGEDVSFTRSGFDDSAWRRLIIPHDWAIEGAFEPDLPGETGKRPFAGAGWYRKHFYVSPNDRGKQVYIDFDGAMAYPAVWLNDKFVGGWAYGYSSFRLDLTPYLKFGEENVLAVRLENLPESSRWYPGAGIYRKVWLVKTATIHVGHWGTYIATPSVSQESASVNVKVTVDNGSSAPGKASVKTSIYKLLNGRKIGRAVAAFSSAILDIPSGTNQSVKLNLSVSHPDLWSPKTPQLYVAVTEILQKGQTLDTDETVFGIRTIKFDPDRGFILNGQLTDIKGVCLHHDLGALGTAINGRALERQIEIMKEMGANAIRTSHNPPAPELLDLADKMGMLVMDEAFDAWVTEKKANDYHLLFADWHEKDLRAQVRRDRNHPSVILWSIGNEIPDQKKPDGAQIAASLTRIVHEEDLTRPVTTASHVAESGFNGFQKTVDVFGYNYKPQEYAKFREANAGIPLIGSETVSAISSRGDYYFPAPGKNEKGNVMADFQVTSYDFQNPSWVAEFAGQEKNPSVAGEFVWTGFDYLGEPAPYDADLYWLPDISDPQVKAEKEREFKENKRITVPSRSSYFGIVDLCGFKKDRFYAYQAHWRPDLPMAHILPHWNWAPRIGKNVPVEVYTSGDEAELFLNGKSLGRKKMQPFEYRLDWNDVVYEPGELKVIAYRNGLKWAESSVKTTGEPAQIQLSADRPNIKADGQDLSFITIRIADKNGSTAPHAANRINFKISGAAEIVAVDNGDATDLDSFQSTNRRAYNGMALVVIRSFKNKKGPIKLRAASNNLRSAEITIQNGF